jgi:hypothetical protein
MDRLRNDDYFLIRILLLRTKKKVVAATFLRRVIRIDGVWPGARFGEFASLFWDLSVGHVFFLILQ